MAASASWAKPAASALVRHLRGCSHEDRRPGDRKGAESQRTHGETANSVTGLCRDAPASSYEPRSSWPRTGGFRPCTLTLCRHKLHSPLQNDAHTHRASYFRPTVGGVQGKRAKQARQTLLRPSNGQALGFLRALPGSVLYFLVQLEDDQQAMLHAQATLLSWAFLL